MHGTGKQLASKFGTGIAGINWNRFLTKMVDDLQHHPKNDVKNKGSFFFKIGPFGILVGSYDAGEIATHITSYSSIVYQSVLV